MNSEEEKKLFIYTHDMPRNRVSFYIMARLKKHHGKKTRKKESEQEKRDKEISVTRISSTSSTVIIFHIIMLFV